MIETDFLLGALRILLPTLGAILALATLVRGLRLIVTHGWPAEAALSSSDDAALSAAWADYMADRIEADAFEQRVGAALGLPDDPAPAPELAVVQDLRRQLNRGFAEAEDAEL